MWRNTRDTYGLVNIIFHWLMAIAVIGMFALGLWMMSLDYYHPWYNRAPAVHKSVGLLLILVYGLRLVWRLTNPVPRPLGPNPLMNRLAAALHRVFYLVLLLMFISGYLIASADGRPISVFGWFAVPGYELGIEQQEEVAGDIHEVVAWTLMALAVGHAGAALKHHFINRDNTLRRMLWPQR